MCRSADTVGYTDVKSFDTPGCRNPSRDDSRQYEPFGAPCGMRNRIDTTDAATTTDNQ
jgi:hypothetical protein